MLLKQYNTLEKHCISLELNNQLNTELFQRDNVSPSESAPNFADLFEINELKAQIQEKDTVILKLKEKIKSLRADDKESKVEDIETQNLELDHRVTKLTAENNHLKQTYKQLFDSIKSSRVQSKEQCDDLINKVNLKSVEVDAIPLVPKLRKNRTAHIDYLKHTLEEAATLRELVESERLLSPLNTPLVYACKYTRRIQELLMILQQTCPRITKLGTKPVAVTSKNQNQQIRRTPQITKSAKPSVETSTSLNIDSNTPVLSSTGVALASSASESKSKDNTKNNRIRRSLKKATETKLEDHPRKVKSSLHKANVVDSRASSSVINSVSNVNANLKCASCNGCLFADNHDKCVVEYINSVNACRKSKSANAPVNRKERVLVITALKEQLKGKAVLSKAVSLNPIDPAILQVEAVPLVPKLRRNRTAHIDYLKHTLEEAATLRELVESERLLSPLNTPLAYACKYTRRIQELLMILQQTCPRITELGTKPVAVTPKNQNQQVRRTSQITKSAKPSVDTSTSLNIDSNTPVLSSTGVALASSASESKSKDNTKNNRIRRSLKKAKETKLEDHPRKVKSSLRKASVVDSRASSSVIKSVSNVNANLKCASCNGCLFADNHDKCVVEYINSVNACRKSKSANAPVNRKNQTQQIRRTPQITKSAKPSVDTSTSLNIDSNTPVLSFTRVALASSASESKSKDNTKNNRIRRSLKKAKETKLEDHPRKVKSSLRKASVVDSRASSSVMKSVSNMNANLKCASCNGCLFADNHDKCVVEYVSSVNACRKSKSASAPVNRKVWKTTGKVFKTVGYKWTPTGRIFTLVGNVCPLTRIATAPIAPRREPIPLVQNTDKPVVTLVYTRKPRAKHVPNKMEPNKSWGSSSNVSTSITNCRLSKSSFGTVKFGNDHVAKITGYGDYQIGNVTISRVYYVEGLGHNLFSVGQFCDSDLEVAFCQHTCFICNLEGVDMLTGSRGTTSCAMGKSTKKSHKPKSEDTNQEKLYLLHMDLCGPMRVESVNGKKYILVIVDDYSRFTWVKFLRSKDETPMFIIKFLKMIQVWLKVPVRRIRTDNGTEFVNQTLRDYYEEVGISHETSVARSPQQNGVVKRRNRTLIEAACTILIYAQAPLFLWAEAVATACFTQSRSIIRLRHGKTPYELIHGKQLDLS
nr:putative ribonuclease H-like domain-containing protein [Tanacetum cinerariifolium]